MKHLFKSLIEKSPVLSSHFRKWRHDRSYSMEPVLTHLGFKFIGNKSMQDGTFEPEETREFQSFINKFDLFVNVGANIGYYCCIALQADKEVIAFEPIHSNVRILLKNIKLNNWDNKISVYPVALSDESKGVVKIFGEGTGASLINGWAGISRDFSHFVPRFTLDSLLSATLKGKRPLILVDIEGAEKYMLDGAQHILAQDPKPVWMVEITTREHQPEHININPNLLSTFKMFWEHGYVCKTVDKSQRIIEEEEVQKIVETGIDTFTCHNFLFYEKYIEQELFS